MAGVRLSRLNALPQGLAIDSGQQPSDPTENAGSRFKTDTGGQDYRRALFALKLLCLAMCSVDWQGRGC